MLARPVAHKEEIDHGVIPLKRDKKPHEGGFLEAESGFCSDKKWGERRSKKKDKKKKKSRWA